MGIFELSQLQLPQLSRLRCVLGLQRPEQLPLVPDGALVAFDAAAEVPELTETLRGRAADAEGWQGVEGDVMVTAAVSEVVGRETTTEGSWRETNELRLDGWKPMGRLKRRADDRALVLDSPASKLSDITGSSSREVEEPVDTPRSSAEVSNPELNVTTEDRDSNNADVTKPSLNAALDNITFTAAIVRTESEEPNGDGNTDEETVEHV